MERILSMVLNIVLRKFLNRGIDMGINKAFGAGKAKEDMTPADHAQEAEARQAAKRARQAANLMRRLK